MIAHIKVVVDFKGALCFKLVKYHTKTTYYILFQIFYNGNIGPRTKPANHETIKKTQHCRGPKVVNENWLIFNVVISALCCFDLESNCRRLSLSNSVHDQDHLAGLYHHHQGGGRRASIQDSLIQFSKTFKIGVSGNGVNNGSELGKYLSRTTLQTILSKHFMDKKLKVR